MSRKIQAVIFDLDGVLVETRKLHFEALSRALKDLGFDLSFEEHHNTYDGLPTYKKIEMLKDRFNLSSEQIVFLNKRKQEYTIELLNGKILPNQEHSRIFSHLKDNDIRVAICSNTKRSTLDYIVNKLEISQYLEFSLSNEDVDQPKPSPNIYLRAMSLLDVTPEETLVFEDSPHGLESARKSKATVEKIDETSDLTFELIKKLVS